MNYLKNAGLIAVFMATAMLAGAGTAAAGQSTFCKANETPCGAGNRYATGTEVTFKAKGMLKWAGYWEGFRVHLVECADAQMKGKTTTTGSSTETVEVVITHMTMLCNGGITTNLNPKLKFNWTSGTMNASTVMQGFDFTFHTTGKTCRYGSEINTGATLVGGSPATLVFKEAPIGVVSGEPFNCGTSAKFSGEFEVSAPNPLYVSNG